VLGLGAAACSVCSAQPGKAQISIKISKTAATLLAFIFPLSLSCSLLTAR